MEAMRAGMKMAIGIMRRRGHKINGKLDLSPSPTGQQKRCVLPFSKSLFLYIFFINRKRAITGFVFCSIEAYYVGCNKKISSIRHMNSRLDLPTWTFPNLRSASVSLPLSQSLFVGWVRKILLTFLFFLILFVSTDLEHFG